MADSDIGPSRLIADGSTVQVFFDFVDGKVMLNKARMSKFGVHLGDVTLSFYKP